MTGSKHCIECLIPSSRAATAGDGLCVKCVNEHADALANADRLAAEDRR